MKQMRKLLALLLVVVLVVQIMPAAVFAEETEVHRILEHEKAEIHNLEEDTEEVKNVFVVGEIPELRGEREKHFRLSDGSNIAVDYGVPVHHISSDGKTWADIDNSLTLSKTDKPTGGPADSNPTEKTDVAISEVYVSKNGANTNSFASDLASGFLFSTTSGHHSIRISLADSTAQDDSHSSDTTSVVEASRYNKSATAEVTYPDQEASNRDAYNNTDAGLTLQMTPKKLRADVLYKDVYNGVDLSYELYCYNIKETIVIHSPRNLYSFSFCMDIEDLKPSLLENGSIELTDPHGEVVYLLPAPYMFDANGAESDAVAYTLEEASSGHWNLKVIADEGWVNDETRAFPVSIDPTVILYPYSGNNCIITSYVNSGRPTTSSYYNTTYLRSGYYNNTTLDPNCTGHTVGLIYVNQLPRVPENCVVTDARLGLVQVKYGGIENVNYHNLYATTITNPNNPQSYLNNMTWNYYSANIENQYETMGDEEEAVAIDYQKEYSRINQSLEKREMQYVITGTAQKWYAGNTSISRLLVLDDGHKPTTTNARVTYGGYLYGTEYAPKFYVTYRNTIGIEGIYGYHTQSIGRAGTGYVNDYTLHPTLSVPIISAPSSTLPFSLSLIYNGALSYTHFTADTNSMFNVNSNIHTMYYSNAKAGMGWKTSVQQTIKYAFYYVDGNEIKYLVYTDADGTEHYFNKYSGNTVYKDEDGLGLTITTYNNDLFTMTDKDNNTWEFTWGYLTKYKDHSGNCLYYAYDGNNYTSENSTWKPSNGSSSHRVTGVWRKNDGGALQQIATLLYENGYLTEIKDADNRTTTLDYNNGQLVSLTFPDEKTASYTYSPWANASGRTYYRLSQACDNETNYRIDYHYWSNNPLQIHYYLEEAKNGNDWISGQRINCFKVRSNYSAFRYFDASGYSGDGKYVTLHFFDSWGRTINVVTMDPEKADTLGVSTGTYTANTEGSSKNNRLTNAAFAGIQSTNLLQNADIEHATDLFGWTKDGTSGSAAARENSGTSVLVNPYLGQYLMKLYESSVTAGEYTVKQSVYLEADKTYVFSAYINTACTGSFGENGGAYLSFLRGTTQKAKSRVINYKTSTAVDGGWERIEVAFTPDEPGTYAVAANIRNISRVAVFDNFQLEKTVGLNAPDSNSAGGLAGTASANNLLQAGSFEFPNASTGVGDQTNVSQWWTYNSSQACPTTAKAHTGSFGLTFAPSKTNKQRASQIIPIYGSSNKTYILSGWGRTPQTNIKSSKEMEGDNINECRFFGLIAKVTYTDTTLEPDYHFVSFNDNIDQWQFASSVIVPKQRDKAVATITVSACLDYCANRAYVDDISLIQEPVQTYDYDEKGNLISATNSEGKSTTTIDDQDRMTGYTAITGVTYELHYTGNNRDPEWIKSDDITTSYTYDAAGNVTQTMTQAPNNGKYLQSNTEYDSTKNFVTKTTDTNGSVSQTSYNTATGVLDWSKNPKNLTTFYTYNTQNNRVASSYITNYAYLYYDYYSDGQLRQLNRKSFPNGTATWQAYNFAYDDWGNTTAIRVWKPSSDSDHSLSSYVTLASYTYNDTGKMTKMRYPSGQYVTYEYDNLDRLVKEVYHNSDESIQVEYQYIYSSDGQLAKQQAIRDGTVIESYSFEYDSLGRLIRSREDSGAASVQRTEHLYDTANRLTKQNWTVGDRNFTETYGYNTADGTMASMLITYDAPTASGGLWVARDKLTYSYDDLNRLTQVLDTENYSTQFYTRNYTYQDLGGSRTTSRLAQYDYRNPSDNDSIIYGNSYAYDANGNITQINEVYTVNGSDTSRVLAEYEYDGLNQLKKETRYTYVGTSATAASTTVITYTIDTAGNIRSVTTKVDGTTTGTVSYTYGNNYWADKLTAISVNGTSRSISYGDYCNPSTWFNGTDYTGLTWTQGRRLSSITKGSDTYSYEYDMSGVRSVKIADGLRHEYVTQNGKVVRETVTNASTGAFQYMLDFTYDESGHPLTMRRYYNEAQTSYNTYHYVLNAQGDVIKLLLGSNTTVAEYSYDAWGNILTATGSLANVNPLRYRGYYYDTETGFYYLQSRYYDPIVKRFLNADAYASTGDGYLGYNMFAYCGNSPVKSADEHGNKFEQTIISKEEEYKITSDVSIVITVDYSASIELDQKCLWSLDGDDFNFSLLANGQNVSVAGTVSYNLFDRSKSGIQFEEGKGDWAVNAGLSIEGVSIGYKKEFALDDNQSITISVGIRYSSAAAVKTAVKGVVKHFADTHGGWGAYPIVPSINPGGIGGGGCGGAWTQTGGGGWYFWVMQPR